MTIYFVGMHNKEGMKPLDSKTFSGKIIDRIISGLNDVTGVYMDCFKTNLCEVEHFPEDYEVEEERLRWLQKYDPDSENDIIVLLGSWTRSKFPKKLFKKIVFLTHPAHHRSHEAKDLYVNDAIVKIINSFQ